MLFDARTRSFQHSVASNMQAQIVLCTVEPNAWVNSS